MTKREGESFKRITLQQRYRALFVNRDEESEKIQQMLEKHEIKIQVIVVKDRKDIPRLVTSERVFVGVHEIKEYLDNWAKLEKIIATK